MGQKQEAENVVWAHRTLMFASITIVMAVLVVIIERTPWGMLVLLLAFMGFSVYPIMYWSGCFDEAGKRKRLSWLWLPLLGMAILTSLIGISFWPSPKIRIFGYRMRQRVAGKPSSIDIMYRNDGHDVRVQIIYRLFYVDLVPSDPGERARMEDDLWAQFDKNHKEMHPAEILEGEQDWGTLEGDALTADQIAKLSVPFPNYPAPAAGIYFMGRFKFLGLVTEPSLSFCNVVQADAQTVPKCMKQY